MPDETLGIRLCGAYFLAPALTGPVRVRTPSPRRVSAFCVVVVCLCCQFALCLCVVSWLCVSALLCVVCACVCVACLCRVCALRVCVVCLCRVSPCEEGSLGRSAQPGEDARVLVGRIIAGLRAPPRAGRPRQGRRVSVHEVCDRQRVVGWSIRPPNRDSSHPTAKPGGGQGVPQGSAAA